MVKVTPNSEAPPILGNLIFGGTIFLSISKLVIFRNEITINARTLPIGIILLESVDFVRPKWYFIKRKLNFCIHGGNCLIQPKSCQAGPGSPDSR